MPSIPTDFKAASKTDRENCYKFRDFFFDCLDKHKIGFDKVFDARECRWALNDFRAACPPNWVISFVLKRKGRIEEEELRKEVVIRNKEFQEKYKKEIEEAEAAARY